MLDQLVQYQAGDDRWMQLLSFLGDSDISQICDNIRSNSGLLSAISQTHGNPSALHGFTTGFVGVLMAEAEKRHLPSRSNPSPSHWTTRRTSHWSGGSARLTPALLYRLHRICPLTGRTLDANGLFDFMGAHFATCSSDDFWSLHDVKSQYEFFGLSLNIAHLQMLAARIAGGGTITEADIHMLARLLKDSEGKPDAGLAGEIAKIDTKADPPQVLDRMAAIVRDYYFGERDLFDPGMQGIPQGKLVNLGRNSGPDLAKLASADTAGRADRRSRGRLSARSRRYRLLQGTRRQILYSTRSPARPKNCR